MDTGVEFSKDLGKPEAGDSSTQNACPPQVCNGQRPRKHDI